MCELIDRFGTPPGLPPGVEAMGDCFAAVGVFERGLGLLWAARALDGGTAGWAGTYALGLMQLVRPQGAASFAAYLSTHPCGGRGAVDDDLSAALQRAEEHVARLGRLVFAYALEARGGSCALVFCFCSGCARVAAAGVRDAIVREAAVVNN